MVNTLVREQHKRDTLTNNPTSVLNRSAFEEMIQDGGIGPLHTSSW